MTVVIQLELILKYLKTANKDFKVFTGLGLHHLTTFTGGWLGMVGIRLTSALVRVEIELS